MASGLQVINAGGISVFNSYTDYLPKLHSKGTLTFTRPSGTPPYVYSIVYIDVSTAGKMLIAWVTTDGSDPYSDPMKYMVAAQAETTRFKVRIDFGYDTAATLNYTILYK